ncbi:hypothetical protein AVEN_172486-1 [Araneus ventricosus]|uniref:Uncharacterized protein n=1 Tax=Araneus ventricosus TaxID=182803 RepID=A0A4Y2DTH7_ARAVE|nr:hypothetical protein AVEN_172486-1 [Araneus ventricosus]
MTEKLCPSLHIDDILINHTDHPFPTPGRRGRIHHLADGRSRGESERRCEWPINITEEPSPLFLDVCPDAIDINHSCNLDAVIHRPLLGQAT